MTLTHEAWWLESKCSTLPYEEADRIFFPKQGGKVNKARKFCNEGCPVVKECLMGAIEGKLEGFFAGTTEKERKVMAADFAIEVTPVSETIRKLLPQAGKKRIFRKIVETPEDTLAYLDKIDLAV